MVVHSVARTAVGAAARANPSERRAPETLGAFVAAAARRHPLAPCLVTKPGFRTRVTTYQDLEHLSLRVARELQRRGVQPGDRVLLWAPNMPEWVAAFFGCHKVGAVVVPLDVRSSPEFAASVVARTQPRLAFLSRSTARDRAPGGPPPLLLEELEAALPPEPALLHEVDVAPDDVAEIIFTSGTTGDPKGAMLTHRNILSNVQGASQVLAIEPSLRLLSILPLSHMLEQTAGLLAPLSGGCRIVYPTSRQPGVLIRTIAENQISMLVLVPQALQLFMNAIEREVARQHREIAFHRLLVLAEPLPQPLRRLLFRSVHARFGGKLATVICGGATLDPSLARRWALLGVTVLQGYGATEASPIIASDRVGRQKLGAVGRAFPGVEIEIAPDDEVLARGPNIFLGYWERPDDTAVALRE